MIIFVTIVHTRDECRISGKYCEMFSALRREDKKAVKVKDLEVAAQ